MAKTTATEPRLTPNALEVLRARYLRKDERGTVVETPAEMFRRVADHVAAAEARYGGNPVEVADAFYEAMARLEFLPNSPTLMNAGTRLGQLAACFVLPVEDSLESIFGAIRDSALIHQSGGGVGYDFSRLRPKGDVVASTGGVSSGPVSFMRVFDASVDAIRQGGRRRGANMGVLRVDHPDIEEFVTAKRDPNAFRNFNLSVSCEDSFLAAVREGREIPLVNPRNGAVVAYRNAHALFELIAECAWETGDPGMIFLDRIDRDNPTPALGRITATNPCGEVPLLPYEACVLGSVNLARLVRDGSVDWTRLGELVELGVRFLDDCIDASHFPLPQITQAVHGNRKIGLGVMGFADALIELGVAYDDPAALRWADEIMAFVAERATAASRALAAERGPFPNFPRSRYAESGAPPIRNATRTAIAPTGTLSLIAGCSSGIEPLYALAYERHVLEGRTLVEVHPALERLARAEGVWTPELRHRLLHRGRVRDDPDVPERLRRLFPTAHEIPPEWHIRVQAAFQAHVDNAVSKTVNLPATASVADVRDAYLTAFDLGCKGITVYREGSKGGQVLTRISESGSCPECGTHLEFAEGGSLCRACGFTSSV
jgi:ribonucleoside-diphosphate reductase alpha chain